MLFRCAYRPSGNGIVDRNHRTIKRMAARSGGDVLDMVHWYNIAPRGRSNDQPSVPCRGVFTYEWKPRTVAVLTQTSERPPQHGYATGQEVFVKPPLAKCSSEWPLGVVTSTGGGAMVEVDGIPRHMADVRAVPQDDSAGDRQEVENVIEEEPDGEGQPQPQRQRR